MHMKGTDYAVAISTMSAISCDLLPPGLNVNYDLICQKRLCRLLLRKRIVQKYKKITK